MTQLGEILLLSFKSIELLNLSCCPGPCRIADVVVDRGLCLCLGHVLQTSASLWMKQKEVCMEVSAFEGIVHPKI